MRYVVTGGMGFIGTHLVNDLARKGHSVHIIDDLSTGQNRHLPEGVTLEVADISTPGVMQAALTQADGCFHLAAVASVERCRKEWKHASHVNVGGTIAVFEAAKSQPQPVPVVYASSAAVYGATGVDIITEATPPKPISSYGVDKLTNEYYASIAWENYGVPVIGMRFFNVYGPGQQAGSAYSGVITLFVNAALKGAPVTIFDDGNQTRDFVFVDDVVHALIAAMKSNTKGAQVYNVCSGRSTSVNDLLGFINQATGKHLMPNYETARAGDIRHSLGSPEKLNATLALPPQAGIVAGLKRTIFAMEHGSAPTA